MELFRESCSGYIAIDSSKRRSTTETYAAFVCASYEGHNFRRVWRLNSLRSHRVEIEG